MTVFWAKTAAAPPPTPDQVALDLLYEHLTPKQRGQYEVYHRFGVTSFDGRRTYAVIDRGDWRYPSVVFVQGKFPLWWRMRIGRISIIRPRCTFCVSFLMTMPIADMLLGYKTMLESREGERKFLTTANPMRYDPYPSLVTY